jgi:predicted metallo-beta-lactamase superfamily hydrolase
VEAEVVAYDRDGTPIMRTVDDGVTLEPHEYVLPEPHQVIALERMEEMFEAIHGETL